MIKKNDDEARRRIDGVAVSTMFCRLLRKADTVVGNLEYNINTRLFAVV